MSDDFPDVKLKVLMTFPASVYATPPLTLDKTGGNFTFGIDLNALMVSLGPAIAVNFDPIYVNVSGDTMTGPLVLTDVSASGTATFAGLTTALGGLRVGDLANNAAGYKSGINIFGADNGVGAGTSIAGTNGGNTSWSIGTESAMFGGAYNARLSIFSGVNQFRFSNGTVGPGAGAMTLDASGVLIMVGTSGSGNFALVNSPTFTGDPKAPTPAPGDNDTSIATTAFVQTALASSGSAADLTTGQNMAVNSGCLVSQELLVDTTYLLTSNVAKYLADCWDVQYLHGANTAVINSYISASAALLAPPVGFFGSVNTYHATAMISQANGDYFLFRQKIEGSRVARLAWGTAQAQPISYAFMFYTNVAGVSFVKISNSARNRCFYREFNAVYGWNFIADTIPGDTSGTWLATNGVGMFFEVFGSGKAASPVAPGAWTATSTLQTTNSQNLANVSTDTLAVTGLYIAPGSQLVASQSKLQVLMRPLADDVAMCRRYYEKSYVLTTPPGTASAPGSNEKIVPSNTIVASQDYGNIAFTVAKRANPTVTMYGFGGTAGTISNQAGTDLAAASGTAVNPGENSFGTRNGNAGSVTTTLNGVIFHWAADARL